MVIFFSSYADTLLFLDGIRESEPQRHHAIRKPGYRALCSSQRVIDGVKYRRVAVYGTKEGICKSQDIRVRAVGRSQ